MGLGCFHVAFSLLILARYREEQLFISKAGTFLLKKNSRGRGREMAAQVKTLVTEAHAQAHRAGTVIVIKYSNIKKPFPSACTETERRETKQDLRENSFN